MQNQQAWKPSKFILDGKQLRASQDPLALSPASRLMAGLVADKYSEHVPAHVSGSLLDLGCGTAPFYDLYRNHVREVFCVDWPQSLHSLNHIDVYCDLNSGLPLSSALFDSVLLSDVLEHIRSPQQLLFEIHRILTPGGTLLLNVPFLYWVHEAPNDYYRYTGFGLKWLLEQADFEVLVLEPLGGITDVLADLSSKAAQQLPLVHRPVVSAIQRSASWVHHCRRLDGLLQRSATLFPLGYFVVARKRPHA